MSQPRRLDCAETRAGNEGVASLSNYQDWRPGCIRFPQGQRMQEAMSTTSPSVQAASSRALPLPTSAATDTLSSHSAPNFER